MAFQTTKQTISQPLLDTAASLYCSASPHPTLKSISDQLKSQGHLDITPLKVRRLLITAGVYKSELASQIQSLYDSGKTITEIMGIMHLSRTSVHSYLPYVINADDEETEEENLCQRPISLEQQKRCEQAMEQFQKDWKGESLWEVITAFAGCTFVTSKGLKFTYEVKQNRHGEPTNELVISRKEKTVTKATVIKAYEKLLELSAEDSEDGITADQAKESVPPRFPIPLSGPKKLGTFGASYLYPIFIKLGLITEYPMLTYFHLPFSDDIV